MGLINTNQAEKIVRRAVKGGLEIAVVVPCYKVEDHIGEVVQTMPDFVRYIVLVDDASPGKTPELVDRLAGEQPQRVLAVHLENNRGVGGAVLAGFRRAMELKADIVVKMDGDGQMDPASLPALVEPLILGKADYTKGNRLRSALSLAGMPLVRRLGNATLSFLIKISSGYWNVIDPANGYLAIRREVLEYLPFDMIHPRYFFESSMLIALRMLRAVVVDVPMDARYRGEKSNMHISRILIEFPWQLSLGFIRRVWLTKILYSMTIEALLGGSGLLLILGGLLWGGVKMLRIATAGGSVPAAVILAAALPILLGFQMMANAAVLDIQSVPTAPLCEKFLEENVRTNEDNP